MFCLKKLLIVVGLLDTARGSITTFNPENTSYTVIGFETGTSPGLIYPTNNLSESEFENSSYIQTTASTTAVASHQNVTAAAESSALPLCQEKPSPESGVAMEFITISNSSGYLQTLDWDGKRTYEDNFTSWAWLYVPRDHVVMLSFTHVGLMGFNYGCPSDFLRMYWGSRLIIWQVCDCLQPTPQIYVTNLLYFLLYFSDSTTRLWFLENRPLITGFRLFYSYHNESARPEKLPNGLWNCSVPFWDDFKQHLACNLELECADGRDERNCPYTSDLCPVGSFKAGNFCFTFVRSQKNVTWKEMKKECYQRGGKLASLETGEVWSEVVRVLRNAGVPYVFVGLDMTPFTFPDVYQYAYRWADGTIAYYMRMNSDQDESGCGMLVVPVSMVYLLADVNCRKSFPSLFLCQLYKENAVTRTINLSALISPNKPSRKTWTSRGVSLEECPDHHLTHAFLARDETNDCWATKASSPSSPTCSSPLSPLPPSFTCDNGVQHVPYSLVCDHRADCGDQSDENFCKFPACQWSDFHCGDKQCIPDTQVCDEKKQCVNKMDEAECRMWRRVSFFSLPPPAVVNFAREMYLNITPFSNSSTSCPDSHIQCAPGGYCLPVFVLCNGIMDCPGGVDETDCKQYTCPGLYRCRFSDVCLHPDHLCDGVFHCPQQDDELFCNLSCPPGCVCYAWAFFCPVPFAAGNFPHLRFLDAKNSMMNLTDFQNNTMLVYLNLVSCGLENIHGLTLSNLRILDVRDNLLQAVKYSDFDSVPYLRELYLTGNPFAEGIFVADGPDHVALHALTILDLGRIPITKLGTKLLSGFPKLTTLNFSQCGIRSIANSFAFLSHLQVIDLRGSDITYLPRDLFSGMHELRSVFADNFKLCCPHVLPSGFNVLNCHTPRDEISSCGDLLRSNFYRILLFVLAFMAVLGNIGSLVLRARFVRNKVLAFGVLVAHLCVSDLLMGVYLWIIGVADQAYHDEYVWKDVEWTGSAVCKLAGFLSFLSSEVSAFIVCLITFDRFVALRYPLSRFHFSKRSAQVACMITWALGFILAGIPLLPLTSHWDFYGQTGICIPLPITRQEFAGQDYSFGVMIVLNFVLFLFIAVGQISIYWSIKQNTMSASSSTRSSRDMTIARRLVTIAVTDFLCWFPIGLLGLLASIGLPISGELNVALAIVALPLNSAINPFLYTLNTILERRRQAREQRLRKSITQASGMSAI